MNGAKVTSLDAPESEFGASSVYDPRWWVRDPDRLDLELRALSDAGIVVERNAEAELAGVLRLELIHPPIPALGEEPLRLVAVYPDNYPYFPVHVEAPDLVLAHHQNPLVKNLCLLARSMSTWRPATDTLAGLLAEQLAHVAEAGLTDNIEIAGALEERVPEPFTTYYPYAPTSMVLVALGEDGHAQVPEHVMSGTFELGLEYLPDEGHPALRGALLAVKDEGERVLLEAPGALSKQYETRPRLKGRWSRIASPVVGPTALETADAVYRASEAADPQGAKPQAIESRNGRRLRVRATLFPEERRWRGESDHLGDGWAFAVRDYPSQRGAAPGARGRISPQDLKQRRAALTDSISYLARPQPYGRADLVVRAPELGPLAHHSVAVFGLGCLGAPSALEFARASIRGLRLMDGDHVDAATTLRWVRGVIAAGWPKVKVIEALIASEYPYTRIEAAYEHFLGEARRYPGSGEGPILQREHESQMLSAMLDGASLLYDACAERSVQYFLAQVARARGLPYVGVQGTAGGWGGMVLSIEPGRTQGCWGCLQHWLGAPADNGGIAIPAYDRANGDVQVEGCSHLTYAGANVDLGEVALMGVRTAFGILSEKASSLQSDAPPDGARVHAQYPHAKWDVAVLSLRDETGTLIPPTWKTYSLRRHPLCQICGAP